MSSHEISQPPETVFQPIVDYSKLHPDGCENFAVRDSSGELRYKWSLCNGHLDELDVEEEGLVLENDVAQEDDEKEDN